LFNIDGATAGKTQKGEISNFRQSDSRAGSVPATKQEVHQKEEGCAARRQWGVLVEALERGERRPYGERTVKQHERGVPEKKAYR